MAAFATQAEAVAAGGRLAVVDSVSIDRDHVVAAGEVEDGAAVGQSPHRPPANS